MVGLGQSPNRPICSSVIMTETNIQQVPVKFPFTPYKVQEEYMKCVIESLQKRVNGVLESPTGTGKTLSLLCSSLAWLQTKKAQVQANAQGLFQSSENAQNFGKTLQAELASAAGISSQPDSAWGTSLGSTQIIYASRTHAQLTQAIKELKRTSYSHVKAAVLGSRDQLCINHELAEDHGAMKTSMCHAKMSTRTCQYFNTLDAKKSDPSFMPVEVMDIEDLVKFGHKTQCCPYYMARELMNAADIVFMPYNYIINPQTRRQQKINLFNAVVLLDEAHNVERICEESASIQTSSTDIALCISEVGEAMKKFADEVTHFQDSNDEVSRDFSPEDLMLLKTMFLALEKAVDEIKLVTDESGSQSLTANGSFIFELLKKAEIDVSKFAVLDQCLASVAQYMSTTSPSPFSRKGSPLFRFADFLKVVAESWSGPNGEANTDYFYKVYLEPEKPSQGTSAWSNTKVKTRATAKIVNFWCFNPGFAMRSLVSQGVHCVILTSGTLAPLQATVSELGIPVPILLENPHVIEPSQISVSVVCKGPTGKSLLGNYSSRDSPDYILDLGYTLVNFSRIVPEGMLVFFSSYSMMSKILEMWKDRGIWSKLNENKPVFVEPQRREALLDVMRDYTTAVEADSRRGAMLIAVLRGKVSEGMDFADSQCRAVFVLGLPYTPYKDPRILLKRAYADQMRKENSSSLSGKDWYELDAVRAVNQAVGRVIRHAHDFGAIVFCDPRFGNPGLIHSLSSWLQPHLTRCETFGQAYSRTIKFFKALGLNPPVKPSPVGASFDVVEAKVRTKETLKSEKKNQESMNEFFGKFRPSQPRPTPQAAPRGLLDALNTSQSQQKVIDIKKVVAKPEEAPEGFVQPAPKKRKIKVIQLPFDTTPGKSCEETYSNPRTRFGEGVESKILTPATSSQALTCQSTSSQAKIDKRESSKAYLGLVKEKLSPDNFYLFKEAVKEYASGKRSYEKTMMCLVKVIRDKELFLGFRRYIKQDNLNQFESLCKKMFGLASLKE